MLLYGLLAFAVTPVASVFFWVLVILGTLLILTFVIKSLSRRWQLVTASFVGLNGIWIFLSFGEKLGFWDELDWRYLLIGAFVLNVIFVVAARKFLKDLFEKRAVQHGANAIVYSLIFLATLVVLNIFAVDVNRKWDFTESSINTLSQQSVDLLNRLDAPLNIYVFVDDQYPDKPRLKKLLGMYEFESDKVNVEFLDPDRERHLAEKYKVQNGQLVVEYKNQSHITQGTNEEGITQAILKVADKRDATICFVQGHGELGIDSENDDPRSLSAVNGGLENEGYTTKVVNNITGGIPQDCSILTIAGPTQMYTPDEVKSVENFLAGGGKAMILLDPNIPNPKLNPKTFHILPTGLEQTLKKWGVLVGQNFILEKHLELLRGMTVGLTVMARNYGNHPIVDPLKGRQTVFQNVQSIQKNKDFSGTALEIISSAKGDLSWAEQNIDRLLKEGAAEPNAGELKGPVPFAVAVEKDMKGKDELDERQTRILVIGDADFASNGMVTSYEFNFDLFLNGYNWLSGQKESITIRPKRLRASAIELTPEQSLRIFHIAIVGIPMLVLIFGMNLWWWRRRKG